MERETSASQGSSQEKASMAPMASMMQSKDFTMKAMRFHEFGGPEVLSYEDVPRPVPDFGEALVRVKAASLNHIDIWVEKGGYYKPSLPHIPGSDAAGIVEEVKDADSSLVGRKVIVYPTLACFHCKYCIEGNHNLCASYKTLGAQVDGSYAEYVTVPVKNLIGMPANLKFEEAAALPLTFTTAYHMLVDRAKAQPNETVLVLGAGAGVGVAAVQIAALLGAKVIATSSSEEKLRKAQRIGADVMVNYSEEGWTDEIMAATNNKGVDVVIDHIGAATFAKSIKCLAKNGRLVSCGVTSGNEATVNIRELFMAQRSILGSVSGTMKDFMAVTRLAAEGKIKPILDSVHSLRDARKAQERLLSRQSFGKIVLVP
ncbi:zinc-binding dehydrogenase [Candidatus Woesearchaeota archaeon]|nr:zinc-binding dehydrogenase [Candidatus Woesearchaeota archaeon]